MSKKIKQIARAWRNDYQYSTLLSSTVSLFANTAFTVFNGVLGIIHHSLWNGTICVYYMLLALIKAVLVLTQRKKTRRGQDLNENHMRKICIRTHLLLLLMDISLIVPISVMVKGERSYTYGMIPAIVMAAYTTYRITMGIIHFRKSRKSDNLLVSELRMINLTDALLALLTLQNSLIIASGGMNSGMTVFSAWTSGGIFAVIVIITVRSFFKINGDG